ncbi:putative membrane protein YfcA [Desulfofundulus luciae]|uniref:Probable membrane transporter protein n=1 Tax=Desulfofundulus luciae TaxID=74702 RepID=A0ABU0B1Z3_9FIRM|nr:sulfite exporter TauE/SafE family protein [Desulfofundulus luciae]MDQ0286754.1 putative membrane protein YfcA [Desulfofundulus luciae]
MERRKKIMRWSLVALGTLFLLSIPSLGEAAGEALGPGDVVKQFIHLDALGAFYLIILGFLGGLISGFIGSGGAFVLTPGMMSLGAPAAIAVASNMCHKFPKSMVGAYKRYKYGQLDLKLGLFMAISAVIGVQVGIYVQKFIFAKWGAAGSNLYVSVAFVTILTIVGLYMLFDARKAIRAKSEDTTSRLAERIKRLSIPPMINFNVANTRVSFWIIVPLGLATGMLAATIAVGGFIGVPGMIYVLGVPPIMASATELVVAFLMGLTGTVTWALSGFVDIRMVLLMLAGSLIGVQLGAVGTTYVKEYMIKLVMATIMLIVSISRGIAIPTYLHQLGILQLDQGTIKLLNNTSFIIMCFALATGGVIVLGNMWKRKRELEAQDTVVAVGLNKT